ncbi:uncharacterized protein LOC134700584 [Mytilus trossulus]|uniref:uncharacterized protein LOC134700584 n=1 Tax=Mytilus trossulus TaxID=6551 RepID=UPI0030066121
MSPSSFLSSSTIEPVFIDVTNDTTSSETTQTITHTTEDITAVMPEQSAEDENESETGFTATATFAAAGAAAGMLTVYGLSKTLFKKLDTSSVSPNKDVGGNTSDKGDTSNIDTSMTNTAKNGTEKEKQTSNHLPFPRDDDDDKKRRRYAEQSAVEDENGLDLIYV